MARTPTTPQPPADDGITDAQVAAKNDVYAAASTALAVMDDNAKTLARQIGYEGALTVGALEDEIRFYQKQTVMALLETGKRLLILKQLTAHGEFQQRVDLLGFNYRTAQRFMAAASKTAKSDTVSLLSTQVKSCKAFLELITHDDDVIDALAEMDDFDKMSASQVRAAARELAADSLAKDAVAQAKQKRIDKLELEVERKHRWTADEVTADMVKAAHEQELMACACIRGLFRQHAAALLERNQEQGTQHTDVLSGMLMEIESAVAEVRAACGLKKLIIDPRTDPDGLDDDDPDGDPMRFVDTSLPKPVPNPRNPHDGGRKAA